MHTVTESTQAFINQLEPHGEKALIFDYDGKRIQPGYHVTEIKAASFRSLDCGANPQQWEETIVQLWDVADQPEQGHMTVRKFLKIYNTVTQQVPINAAAQIKFECGDAVNPAVHYNIGNATIEADAIIVALEPVRATCKPRDLLWLAEHPNEQPSACCTPAQTLSPNTSCCAPTTSNASCCSPATTLVSLDAIR